MDLSAVFLQLYRLLFPLRSDQSLSQVLGGRLGTVFQKPSGRDLHDHCGGPTFVEDVKEEKEYTLLGDKLERG